MPSIIRKGEIPTTPQGFGDGSYVDEVITLDGYFADWAHLWRHRNPAIPVRWSDDRLIYGGLSINTLEPTDRLDARGKPLPLLTGKGITISLSRRSLAMPFAEKNVDAHQIRFYQKGRFQLETELGMLAVEAGDFVVIPKSLLYRETPLTADNEIVIFEVERPIALAEKLQDKLGFASLFIDYSTMELPCPRPNVVANNVETEVRVKFDNEYHTVTYDFDPVTDVFGWSGDPILYKLNVWNIPSLGSSFGFTSPPSNAVLFAEDKSHLNDYDEVWLNHAASVAPETDGHFWLFPRTVGHPGLKVAPVYPTNPPQMIREVKINFDTLATLNWTSEAKAALMPHPTEAIFTSFYGAHAGVSEDILKHVRR
jgi:homogentisate 1,2-dioxygenase